MEQDANDVKINKKCMFSQQSNIQAEHLIQSGSTGGGGGGGQVHAVLCWGNLRERDNLKDPGTDGIILKWNFNKWNVVAMDWIYLTPDRDMFRAVLSAVMNIRFHKMPE
jgi:hypothetical protein